LLPIVRFLEIIHCSDPGIYCACYHRVLRAVPGACFSKLTGIAGLKTFCSHSRAHRCHKVGSVCNFFTLSCSQVVTKSVAPAIKTSKIGPAIDLDMLLLILVHEFMDNSCPVSPLEWPRRITDGRLPALTNLGGCAMGRQSGVTLMYSLSA
jgi:hypothetical protein